MDHLLLVLKYVFVSLLVWFACKLSNLPLTLTSSFILGASATFIEFRYKVWVVKQLKFVQETNFSLLQDLSTQIRNSKRHS
jgi:uncharacterized membrane-anchored protein YitT (DUF2179 family)